ncbi:alpha-related fimbriae major subunit [Yersinia frederiksenii]|nr:alpha-related fimbriae major subunit [Yersinia frederiksenii]
MNIKYKKLLMGLMLLILQPTAIASPLFYNDFVQRYSNCSVKLSDDYSVSVSFNVEMVSNLFADGNRHQKVWAKLVGVPNQEAEVGDVYLHPYKALLSLYFYNADGSPNVNIGIKDLNSISLNGATPDSSSDNIKEIKFNHGLAFNDKNKSYEVSFTVNANVLKYIRIGATVGGQLGVFTGEIEMPTYSLLASRGVSFGPAGKKCKFFDPQANIAPDAFKVSPNFQLSSAVWQLKSIDLDSLLERTADNNGSLHLQLENASANRFCINYRAMGVQNNNYMISASNINALDNSGQYFQLKEKEGNNLINYNVRFVSDENLGKTFVLPKDKKFIQLKADNYTSDEEMCWSPEIHLYRTDSMDKGGYSDTLTFTITPES